MIHRKWAIALLGVALVFGVTPADAKKKKEPSKKEQTKKDDKSESGSSKGSGRPGGGPSAGKKKDKIKPYDEVITEEAVSDTTGLFKTHVVGDKLFFEIPKTSSASRWSG